MVEYFIKAAGVWLIGFSPFTGIISAVPTAVALGLDDISILLWSVLGSFTPALLISTLYKQMTRIPRVNTCLQRLDSKQMQERINRWGIGFVLLATPWVTVWAMAVTAKLFNMERNKFLLSAFFSIAVYATGFLVLIRFGVAAFE